tara:strand:+ start:2499 stop:2942 length:444 start_codon:yes stop_codon:yes gene_type:complete
MIKQMSIKTKIGWISAYERNGKIFKVKFGKLKKQIKSQILQKFRRNLLKYLNKKTPFIKIPYIIKGNQTQVKIWKELQKIKKGKTKSYGQIAKKYKISPRYVGKICGQNKLLLIVPCHRVIKTNGDLGGFSSLGGVNLKRELLELEK